MKHPQYLSLAEHAYQRLLDEIVRGVRPAGSKMSEEGICAELEISRTPAREALMQLHRDGIVERLPRRGCFVKGFDPAEIAELFECRIWIEALALEQAFDRIPDKELAKLEKALKSSPSESTSLKADDQLHTLIAESCPNRPLREFAMQLLRRSAPVRFWRTHGQAPLKRVSKERLQIIRAIRKQDKAAAIELLKAHIGHGRDLMLKLAGEETVPAKS